MTTAQHLAKRFREVMLNGKWIANTNWKDQLDKVGLEEANHKIGALNTIAALTFHVNYYIAGLNDLFAGGELTIRDKFSFDAPVLDSENAWRALADELAQNSEVFAQHVENMSEEKLAGIFVNEKYGNYRRNIEGMIEHSYYHLGQVSLIRKMLSKSGSA